MAKNSDGSMPILEHFVELRLRIAISAGAFLVAVIFCFANIELIRGLLTIPLEGLKLIYLSPPEAFVANLRLAFISGLILSSPVIIYEISAFIFPGLTGGEKKFYVGVILGILILFSAGVFFAYYIAYPFTLFFFLRFAAGELEPRFTVSEYISFIFSFHMAIGLVFQLPLFTWALGKMGLISTQFLRKHRKVAVLILLLLSAVITPPDIISQLILIIPLTLLYELGILMVLISERKRNKERENL